MSLSFQVHKVPPILDSKIELVHTGYDLSH